MDPLMRNHHYWTVCCVLFFENESVAHRATELGIYPEHIWSRTKAVLNPLAKAMDNSFLEDRDVAGPLVFCFVLGVALLMTGKMYLGYIYGIGFVGSIGIYCLLHVMTEHNLGKRFVVCTCYLLIKLPLQMHTK
jgi:hypothetical protein